MTRPEPVPALRLTGVSKEFGGLRAVDGVSLTVAVGERRAIIGPNGAGKTTLFSLISGEQPVTGGQIELFGHPVTRVAPHRRAALGLARTYQITNLFPRLTVMDNCLLAVQALRPTKFHLHRSLGRYPGLFARAEGVLEAVGLSGKAGETVRNLSHGEQRQLEIALALAGQPRLLLLDEPTAGLSPAESNLMAGLLKKLDPAITTLMIEHDMDIAFQVTDRITVLHYGSVVADGLGDEVKANPLVQEIYLGTP
jgi:branched-chain amino acid transport system ATP-binding protein